MRFPNFLGASFVTETILGDAEDLINWQVQPNTSKGAKSDYLLLPTAGCDPWADVVNNTICRASFAEAGQVFKVIGNGFYEFFENKTFVLRGTVVADSSPAMIRSNGNFQLLVTSANHAYCHNRVTNTFTEVATSGARQGGVLSTYGLLFDAATGRTYYSDPGDLLTWDFGLGFFERSTTSDPAIAMIVNNYGEVLLMGEKTTEPWVPTSDPDDPFAPKGIIIPHGIGAAFSAVSDATTVLWLSRAEGGAGQVLSMSGYNPRVVSNPALDAAISRYRETSRIDDAEAWAYQENGHECYVLSFPTVNKTWVLDRSTGFWTPRGTWNVPQARYDRWRPSWHCYEWNTHLVGDSASGQVYRLSSAISVDAGGGPIRRERVTPGVRNDGRRVTFDALELYIETGVGNATLKDPQITLYCSDDGGHTWWSAGDRSIGKQGQFGLPVIWDCLGSSYDRVFKVVASGNVPYRIVDAYLRLRGEQRASA